ncbi:MAG: Do family serine endopeptidase [Sedimentisphaerales bacterium]
MQIDNLKHNRTSFRRASTYVLLFLLIVMPVSAFAEDQNSVAALREMGQAFSSIAEKASPAVVGLSSQVSVSRDSQSYRQYPFDDDLFEFFFGPRTPRQRTPQRRQQPVVTMGSGFIISPDGYILTNNHMVQDAKKIKIELADDRKFDAEVIGTDPESDIAVVKIDTENLPYLEMGDSDNLKVGEWVLAIGNPLGFSHTVTAGIVSAKGRSGMGLANFESFIQTDAAINRGNSGGPLLNLEGKVVGINTAIVGATGNIGIGFAIPINMAKYAYKQLKEGGSVERGFLGISFGQLDPGSAATLGLAKDTKGIIVTDVRDDTPAQDAGLQPYDVIVELDGAPVGTNNEFLNHVAMLKPGTKINLVVLRDGKRKPFTIKLGKRPPEEELSGALQPETTEELGFTVQDLTKEYADRFGYGDEKGVIVTEVDAGSQAADDGMTPGTLIKEVNRQPVTNTRQFNDAIKKAKKSGGALLLVKLPNGYTKIVYIKFSE